MVNPYNYSTNEDYNYLQESWYKEFAKGELNEIKIKFEDFENRKLSNNEFNEMYEDYRHSGLGLDDYMKDRKFR